jgi:hypothetical protein
MHQRFLPWLLIGVLFASFSLRAHAASGQFKSPGKILVARVVGKATKTLNGSVTELKKEDAVETSAKVNTIGANSSVVLAFSNGATTRLGGDTELVIDEFLQDPFSEEVRPSTIDAEPTPSRTKLSLNRGELVGDVKKLKLQQDAAFTVQTPVGAAGVRGTVFRIVFRPSSTPGQALFQLSTAAGLVDYQGINATGAGTAKVDITQGQEISFTVSITINAQGQIVVNVQPPPPGATTGIPANTLAQVATAATDIAGAVINAVFSPPRVIGGQPTGSIGATTTSSIRTENATGTVTVTNPQPPQNAIPTGQITSQP